MIVLKRLIRSRKAIYLRRHQKAFLHPNGRSIYISDHSESVKIRTKGLSENDLLNIYCTTTDWQELAMQASHEKEMEGMFVFENKIFRNCEVCIDLTTLDRVTIAGSEKKILFKSGLQVVWEKRFGNIAELLVAFNYWRAQLDGKIKYESSKK